MAKAIAEKIMRALSARRGIDLYQYDDDIIDEIREEIADIVEQGAAKL
jgi:hypothetical protein